jgi:nucleotide-binding universal stress UspA family protein
MEVLVMFDKILVPVDGSEAAWHALEYATVLGEKFHSTITIVHVVQAHYTLPTVGLNGEIPFISLNIQEVETTGYKIIELAKERMGNYPTFETTLEFGHPAERILSLVKENAHDLIVIGSRGLSGISEFFLGSISNNVSQYSSVPVMIVK